MSDTVELLLEDVPIRVNGYDIDFAGMVSNIVYIRWLEDVRTLWCEKYLPVTRMFAEGYCPIVLSTQIEYRVAIRMNDLVTAAVAMSREGRLRWRAKHRITVDGRIAATAEQTGIFISLATKKPLPNPPAFQSLFEQKNDASCV